MSADASAAAQAVADVPDTEAYRSIIDGLPLDHLNLPGLREAATSEENSEVELVRIKEHFAKLKFNFVELQMKQYMLEAIAGSDMQSIFPSDEEIAALEEQVAAAKADVKSLKESNERKKELLLEKADTVAEKYESVLGGKENSLNRVDQLGEAIEALRMQHAAAEESIRQGGTDEQENSEKIAALEGQLAKQTEEIQRLTEARRAAEDEARECIRDDEKLATQEKNLMLEIADIEASGALLSETEEEALRGKISALESLERILTMITGISLNEILGDVHCVVSSDEPVNAVTVEDEIQLVLSRAGQTRELRVRFAPGSARIASAELFPGDIDIAEITEQSLPLLVLGAASRVSCVLERRSEFAELSQRLHVSHTDDEATVTLANGVICTVQVSNDYPSEGSTVAASQLDAALGYSRQELSEWRTRINEQGFVSVAQVFDFVAANLTR